MVFRVVSCKSGGNSKRTASEQQELKLKEEGEVGGRGRVKIERGGKTQEGVQGRRKGREERQTYMYINNYLF